MLGAEAETVPADAVLFDFHRRQDVLVPTPDGRSAREPQRVVFSLNGLGIGDASGPAPWRTPRRICFGQRACPPRTCSSWSRIRQARASVRFAAMKLETIGVGGEVINGLTSQIGNVSSCSIPYALKQAWHVLDGTIACPAAGVGPPGEAKVSQGCILLRRAKHRAGAKAFAA